MSSFDSVKMGICEAHWKAPGATAFVDLGLTQGGCEFKYTPKWKEIFADQFGETPIDWVLQGETVTAKVPMLESTKEKIAIALPVAKKTGTGDATVLSLGCKPGKRASDVAGTLVLHPISSTGHADDITIHLAMNTGEMTLPFTIDKQHVIECQFTGLIDKDQSEGGMLCAIGADTLGGVTLNEAHEANEAIAKAEAEAIATAEAPAPAPEKKKK